VITTRRGFFGLLPALSARKGRKVTPEYPVVSNTGLLVPAINSPNFNLQNPAASPNPSWAILQNGLAYFFGLTLTGGTLIGPDYVINTNGAFFYNGTPALGNLYLSIASSSGTDAYGNTYPPGVTSYFSPTGTGYIAIENGQLVLNNSGFTAEGLIALTSSGEIQISGGTGVTLFVDAPAQPIPLTPFTGTPPINTAGNGIVYANAAGTPAAETTAGWVGVLSTAPPADFTTHTVTQTAPTQLSDSWSVPAADAQAGTVYRLTAAGTATWGSTQQALTLALSAFGVANFASLPIGATEFTASLTLQWRLVADVAVKTPGNPATILGGISLEMGVAGANELTQVGTNQSAGGFVSFNAANATADTAVNSNVTLQAKWASTTGASTITCDYSYIERLGA
jgi:hypothetical protein